MGIYFFEYMSDVINRAAAIPPKKPVNIQKYRELYLTDGRHYRLHGVNADMFTFVAGIFKKRTITKMGIHLHVHPIQTYVVKR